MRRVFIPSELEQQIESVRGETSFDQWLALAIAEKVWGSRFSTAVAVSRAIGEEIWLAIAHLPDGLQTVLLWRYAMPHGVALAPVIAASEEDIRAWEELFGLEINVMGGPPIEWRHFSAGEFAQWLRAPLDEEQQ